MAISLKKEGSECTGYREKKFTVDGLQFPVYSKNSRFRRII
jgi:hypothetical protein